MPELQPSKNPSGADNEQGSPTELELAWLAGIFDGEGWIGINRQIRKSTGLHRYSAGCVIATTSPLLAGRIHDIFARMGVTHSFIRVEPKQGKDGSWRRRKWNISVSGNTQTEKLLSAIKPLLVEKWNQARLTLHYIQQRSRLPSRPGGNNPAINQEIRDLGERYRALLHADRTRDDPSTTTRLAPVITGGEFYDEDGKMVLPSGRRLAHDEVLSAEEWRREHQTG